MLTQGISAVVVGPDKINIMLELDLCNRALKIQQTVGNTNWILRAGVLHIVFAAFRALGKIIDGSGVDTCVIEKSIYTLATLRGIYVDKAYKRGIEYHITTSLAIIMMLFNASAKDSLPESIWTQCDFLRRTPHKRSPDTNAIFEIIQSWYTSQIKRHATESTGEQVGYLAALENIIKYSRVISWKTPV